MIPVELKQRLLDIAMLSAPFDTGNLMRSIVILDTPYGADIVSRGTPAPYNIYTDRKWVSPRWGGKQNPNEGWFSVNLPTAVSKHIKAYYNNAFDSETVNYRELAERTKNFPAQNEVFLNSIRR